MSHGGGSREEGVEEGGPPQCPGVGQIRVGRSKGVVDPPRAIRAEEGCPPAGRGTYRASEGPGCRRPEGSTATEDPILE